MRTCEIEGCAAPHRARGMCNTHYNQTRYTAAERHKKIAIACAWCGRSCEKAADQSRKYAGRFCSLGCRDAWRVATGNNPAPTRAASEKGRAAAQAVLSGVAYVAKRKLKRAARGTTGPRRGWTAGWCERCGEAFVSLVRNDQGRYCSDACKHRAAASRRRARVRGAHHVRYSRQAIFERDNWRCHICKRKTMRTKAVPHPRAPVIDHLVPLAEGGDDTAANVATACFMCNSIKREFGGNEQLALIG